MSDDLHARGQIESPILIVGDSLPEKEETQNKLLEILDRRGSTYNSIIIPLKYYINEYLIHHHKLKLPYDWNNKNDIFRFVNAIKDPKDKWGFGPEKENYSSLIQELKEEIFDDSKQAKYKMIICMGDFAYFATRTLFGLYHGRERKFFPKSKSKYSIEKLGGFFSQKPKVGNTWILPILHNSSNLQFHRTQEFIPNIEDERGKYVNYLNYIAKDISEIIVNDIEIKKYLIKI